MVKTRQHLVKTEEARKLKYFLCAHGYEMTSRQKNRRIPRARIELPVMINANSKVFEGVTQNISGNGVFIRCAKPLRLNEIVEISIDASHYDRALHITVEVVWSNIYGPDDEITPRGMGVVFIKISDEDRKLISQVISDSLESEGSG
jgi:uncharacterized protein (TIGR02266 family)